MEIDPRAVLELVLRFQYRECVPVARELRARLTDRQWTILATLAAEVVSLHESAEQGATRVLVVSEKEAQAVLAGK